MLSSKRSVASSAEFESGISVCPAVDTASRACLAAPADGNEVALIDISWKLKVAISAVFEVGASFIPCPGDSSTIWQSFALGRQVSAPLPDCPDTLTLLVNRNTAFLPPFRTPREMTSGDCEAGN